MMKKYFNDDIIADMPILINPLLRKGKELHLQDFVEILVVWDGAGSQSINGRQIEMKKGDIFLLLPDALHELQFQEELHCACIVFHMDFIRSYMPFEDFSLIWADILGINNTPAPAGGYTYFYANPTQLSVIESFIQLMFKEFVMKRESYKFAIREYLLTLLTYVKRMTLPTLTVADNNFKAISTAVSYLENHFAEMVSLEKLASLSFLSPRHFSRIFKDAYRCTPNQYQLQLRLKYAVSLMQDDALSLAAIAELCGYTDHAHFTKHFKASMDVTPRAFREKHFGK